MNMIQRILQMLLLKMFAHVGSAAHYFEQNGAVLQSHFERDHVTLCTDCSVMTRSEAFFSEHVRRSTFGIRHSVCRWNSDAIRDEHVHPELSREPKDGVDILRVDDDVASLLFFYPTEHASALGGEWKKNWITSKLWEARSRPYRRRFLQRNIRWKDLQPPAPEKKILTRSTAR